jgi:CheY-like chemotaxis protein
MNAQDFVLHAPAITAAPALEARPPFHLRDGGESAHRGGDDHADALTPGVLPAPGREASAQPAPEVAPQASRKRRVLVADDNVDAATSMAMMLEIMGNEVRAVHDGEAAVEAAQTFRPHVILLDIGMPKLNGYDACRRIRSQPDNKHVVIAALTGWGQDKDKSSSEQAGFNHHLVKPVDPIALQKLLSAVEPGV